MSDDQVQEIKDRVDIVDLVNQYVPLKRSGLNHKGLCPFHKERTPSFMVNPERQIFKCFGCDESGDVLTFVQKMEGLTFPEALELLADRVGIKLDRRKAPEQYKQEKDEKTTLYRLNAAAAKFFHHLLLNHPSGKAALDYLHGRSVRDDTIKQFQLGYAPSKSILGQWLAKYGFTSTDLRKAGSPERFSNRIMFPLRDTLGNVVGFTGRLLESTGVRSKEQGVRGESPPPKYFNTPETPIFKKSALVYGLAEGKREIRTRNAAILVEGQMDVILSHQAGVRVAVASSGTALTLDHLKAIRRYTGNVLIAFDADEAGVNATKKTIGLTFDAEVTPKIVVMPSGCKDAGEAIQQDPKLWAEALKNAQPAIDWLISAEILTQLSSLDSPSGSTETRSGQALDGAKKKAVAKVVLPMLMRVQDPVERAHYVGQLANKLHIPEQSLLDALSRTKQRRSTPQPSATTAQPETRARALSERLAGLVALHPSVLDAVSIPAEHFPKGSFAHRLFSAVKTWYDTHDRQAVANSFNSIRSNFHPAQQAQLDLLALEMQELLADHNPAEMAQEFVVRLRRDSNESLKASIAEAMREAEAKGDRAAVKKLMTELQSSLKS